MKKFLPILFFLLTVFSVFGQADGNVLTVTNVAQLRTLSPFDRHKTIHMRGYYTPGDGGGGTFVWTNSVSGTNTGTRISSTTSGWSLERVYDGPITPKWFGAKSDGVTDDTAAIQAAINFVSFGGVIDLGSGNYSITSTLFITQNKQTFGSFANGANGNIKPRIVWNGASGGTMLVVSNTAARVQGLTLDANSLANTCVRFNSTEHQSIRDCFLRAYKGDGLIVGNATANNNNFIGENLRLLFETGGSGILVDSQGTENVVFRSVSIARNSEAATASNYLIKTTNGVQVSFYDIIVDDNYTLNDYAIQIAGNSQFYNLQTEVKMPLKFYEVGKNRGNAVYSADLRGCDPASGKYAIEATSGGNNGASITLVGVKIVNISGATVVPNIRVNNCTVIALGCWWEETGTSPGKGTFSVTSTGRLFDLSAVNPGIQWSSLTLDSNSALTNNGPSYLKNAYIKGPNPWIDVVAYGADVTGATDSHNAITNAIAAAGTGGSIYFPRGLYKIGTNIAIGTSRRLFGLSGTSGDSPTGVRLEWTGASGGTMLTVSGGRTSIEGIIFDAASLANTCVSFANGDSYQIRNCFLDNYIDYGLVVGNGSGNNNGFSASNLRFFYQANGRAISVNANSSDLLRFENIIVAPTTTGLTPRSMVVVSSGHADFYNLSIDDSGNLADYSIKVSGTGTIGIYGLTASCRQALQVAGSAMERPNIVQRAELRNINPTSSSAYAMDLSGTGANAEQTFLLNGVKVQNLSGAAIRPHIRIAAAATVVAQGVWFTETGTSPGQGTITNSATGKIIRLGTNSFVENLAIKGPSPWVDVTAFGADKTGVSDSTTAIANAIAASSGRVYFPAGTYAVLGTDAGAYKQGIQLGSSNIELMGDGPNRTIIKTTEAAEPANIITLNANVTNVTISGIGFLGNGWWAAANFNGGRGIQSGSTTMNDFRVINCHFLNFPVGAIDDGAKASAAIYSQNITIRDCKVINTNFSSVLGIGFQSVRGLTVDNNYFEKVSRPVSLESKTNSTAINFRIVNNVITGSLPADIAPNSNTQIGVLIQPEESAVAEGGYIAGNQFRNNSNVGSTGAGSEIAILPSSTSTGRNIVISGNTSIGYVGAGPAPAVFRIGRTRHITILGNILQDPQTANTTGILLDDTFEGQYNYNILRTTNVAFNPGIREQVTSLATQKNNIIGNISPSVNQDSTATESIIVRTRDGDFTFVGDSFNISTNVVFSGQFTGSGQNTFSGNFQSNTNAQFRGPFHFNPSTLQTLEAGSPIVANAGKLRVAGSGGAVTLTAAPTIADGLDGQLIFILGTSDTNTLTVQDQDTLASSNIQLEGVTSRTLGKGDILQLQFDSIDSLWYEVKFTNN